MRKQNSIIFGGLLSLVLLSGCGMPGPLYQETDDNKTTKTSNEQQPVKKQERE